MQRGFPVSSWCSGIAWRSGIAAVLALTLAPQAQANPIPEPQWRAILAIPGRYLREPNAETRRAFVRTLGFGNLDVYLQTPDTLALMLRNLEALVPLCIEAQKPPHVPDEDMQAWFRSVAPRHRDEMIQALKGWFAPGADSIAPYHGEGFPHANPRQLAWVRSTAAQRLADWDAPEVLPELRALRTRLGDEVASIGADSHPMIEGLDDAIRRLEGWPGLAPLVPDGHGGFRSRFQGYQIASATLMGSSYRTHQGVLLERPERESLWSMVLAAHETTFAGYNGTGSMNLGLDGGVTAHLELGPDWGEVALDQYPHPTQRFSHAGLYARILSLAGGVPPRSFVAGIRSWTRFRREHVLITIDSDSIHVRGRYDFVSDSAGRPFAVRFPAVQSSGHPPLRDWFASIENPQAGAIVLPRHYALMDSGFIVFPGVAHDTVRVLASCRDWLAGRCRATYLLTTVRAWGEPLDRAVLEVDWPDSLGKPRFSLPLARVAHSGNRTRYRYEAAPFQPDTDLVVTWEDHARRNHGSSRR